MLEIILVVVLIVLLVALFVISSMKKKKFNQEMGQMRDELKKGDKVMTDSGVVGEVVDSYTEDEYKYFVLKSGKGENTGFFTVHANAIYYVFGKELPNAEKKVVVVAPKKEEPKTDADVEEQKVEEVKEEPAKEEQNVEEAKTSGKKSSKTKKETK